MNTTQLRWNRETILKHSLVLAGLLLFCACSSWMPGLRTPAPPLRVAEVSAPASKPVPQTAPLSRLEPLQTPLPAARSFKGSVKPRQARVPLEPQVETADLEPLFDAATPDQNTLSEIPATQADAAYNSSPDPEPGVKIAGLPDLMADDMSMFSLRTAIDRQLEAMAELDPAETVRLADRWVTQRELMDTLRAFKALLAENPSPRELTRRVQTEFEVISVGRDTPDGDRQVLFTGYYTPIIEARRERTGEFTYPLYRKPEAYPFTQVVYRRPAPGYRDRGFHVVMTEEPMLITRRQIDGEEILRDQNLEVAWLKDDLERYFLHIQGSGFLAFPDGTLEAVQYMGSNDLPYDSIGRRMIREGVITTGQGSMQGIKQYFREHPEDIQKYLFHNRRYIFFNLSRRGPTGSGGAELVAGRAIATDKSLYPAGGLVFITGTKPVLDPNNEIVGWKSFSRFVLDQDTGSAIRGPGRADLYFGVGETAGAAAGHYMRTGRMFYLLKR